MSKDTGLPQGDIDIIRGLAERKARLAEHPANLERKAMWYALDAGARGRPMVLAEFGGVRDESPPLPSSLLECSDDWARGLERALRCDLYQFEVLKDDHVLEPYVNLNWCVQIGDYGVKAEMHHGDNAGRMGSRRWDPPIRDLDRDFDKLHPRTCSVDRDATEAGRQRLEAVFDGILPVRIRGGFFWTMGMTWPAIELIGLENLMLYMFDNPAGLHRLMAFLRDDHLAFVKWLEAEGLLTLNNENDYIGSGSMGYTRDLPQAGAGGNGAVRSRDLWVLSESQETVGVGPDQFQEFIFPYQVSVVEPFGRCYYGCCEPVHSRWHILKEMPHLARVSVSPWADEAFMAAAVGRGVVYSRKPNPTLVSTAVFDEDAIRQDLRHTLETAADCRVEIAMKDVHTLHNEPDRLARWVQLAREIVDEVSA